MFLAVFFPTIKLQPAFDQHGRPSAEILVGDFGRSAPERDIDERDFVNPLIAALYSVIDGEPNVGHGCAAGDVPQLGIAGQISDQDNSVKACHDCLLSDRVRRLRRSAPAYTKILNTRSGKLENIKSGSGRQETVAFPRKPAKNFA